MARYRIRKIAEQQGVKDATELQFKLKIGYSLARQIWRGDADLDIRTSTLEHIAQQLGVKVHELFATSEDEP